MSTIFVGGPHNGHFWKHGVLGWNSCTISCFPVALPQPSSQEIPKELEAHSWVCDCTREGGLLCGAKFSIKSSSPRISCKTQGGTHGSRSWSMLAAITNVCPWCNSSSPYMWLSLRLIFWNTQEILLIVTTRGAISFNLQQNLVPDQTGPFLICWVLGMFAEKTNDCSVFCSVVVVQIFLALVVPSSVFVSLGVFLFSVSALELTTAKWDAETS